MFVVLGGGMVVKCLRVFSYSVLLSIRSNRLRRDTCPYVCGCVCVEHKLSPKKIVYVVGGGGGKCKLTTVSSCTFVFV